MNLIERKCIKNENGSFSFFKLTGVNKLIYIPVDSTGKKPIDDEMHLSEISDNTVNTESIVDIDVKNDLETRIEQVERAYLQKLIKS